MENRYECEICEIRWEGEGFCWIDESHPIKKIAYIVGSNLTRGLVISELFCPETDGADNDT